MKNEKIKKAAALKYEVRKDHAPRLTAKGSGPIAARIIELAQKEGIPIQTDPNLIGALMQLDLQEEIPVELYKVVAEILAFVYRLNRQKTGSKQIF
jgi:flagellar biosynthesis protein